MTEGSKGEVKTQPVTRETLYAQVWSEPMLKVAATYGVSSPSMAATVGRNQGTGPDLPCCLDFRVLQEAAPEVAQLVEKAERDREAELRKWEAQRLRWAQEERERKAAEALQASRKQLLEITGPRAHSKQLEAFFEETERRIQGLADVEREVVMLERVRRGREMIGSTDALEKFLKWRLPPELAKSD